MSDYISNPNQKDININKLRIDDNSGLYTRFRFDALQTAMKTLSPKAFEMWCYLGKNKDGFKLYLSKVDCLKWCNISASSYHNAFKELVDNKYLIAIDNNFEPKHYDFYELPQGEEKEVEIEIHKSTDIDNNGFIF